MEKKNDDYPLKDKTFVFTGELSIEREEAKEKVILLGGRVTTAPSSKTTYLVTGDEPGPSKLEKAKNLGIKILKEDEFMQIILKNSKNLNDSLVVDLPKENLTFSNEIWCEKYRPKSKAEFVGNKEIINQLENYLKGKTDKKAVLLSGPPGCGKTTMAYFVAKELNFNIAEFNASDVRNKSEILKKIKSGIFSDSVSDKIKKKVLIMDEVDGMSSDRGGIPELTKLIKSSKIPVICICNDRYHPKIRTLSNYCLDLRFRKLDARQILPRIKEILKKEGKQLLDPLLNDLILHSNGDLRYILNSLQNLTTRTTISMQQSKDFIKKNVLKNIFEIASEIFRKGKISEKLDLYFEEYNTMVMFVYENYLKVNHKTLKDVYEASESISFSEIIENKIYGPAQMWNLAPLHGFFSCVNPTKEGFLKEMIKFPTWLGFNSNSSKNQRNLIKTLKHGFKHFKVEKNNFRLFYLEVLMNFYEINLETQNVDKCLEIFLEYDLLREDLENLFEIFPKVQQAFKKLPAKIKSNLTSRYKKMVRDLPYFVEEVEKKEEEEEEVEEEKLVDFEG
ncbi:DNA replication factor C subunit [Tubulinosema ratisbonensis]|uniref:Replication factor C subunit 1 n=1 Tax=Tubulinosema ratisbonensis TaxID=291195 RepID=A0A437AKL2_9MICR|nr:DNA replication factor C subunit [Tubulinosema ratisbonensis]